MHPTGMHPCCIYGNIDLDEEVGHRTPSLHLHYVSIDSIIFKTNVNGSLMLQCERTFKQPSSFLD